MMRSGLRGGKPRDMATFKKGGPSRGAGAAKKGFDYSIYKKGGKVKKYADGGEVGSVDPSKGVREYSWSDLFGSKKSKAGDLDEINLRASREVERAREATNEQDRETRRAQPGAGSSETQSQRRRMRRRMAAPMPPPAAPYEGEGMPAEARDETMPSSSSGWNRYQRTHPWGGKYADGGAVKKAQGGSCRGMGAAQRGGKYSIK